ncbi:hypothetical protein [Streptomyces sp. NPDC058964]|uniref:hypothetical protein n=1 Tax=Streptomyces sp. NPDC058964 TaxID=3346681 RepID=UPI0036AE1104
MNHDTTLPDGAKRKKEVVSTHSVFGAPCWVSLTSRDLKATEDFYGAVLGWRWRNAKLGDHFRIALAGGVPVAGIAAVAAMWQMAVAWTPYFAVPNADEGPARGRGGGAPWAPPPGPRGARGGGARGRHTEAHCRAYAQTKDRGKALDATAWQRLVAAAGGKDEVAAYCSELLARAAAEPGKQAGTGRPGAGATNGGTGTSGKTGSPGSGTSGNSTPGNDTSGNGTGGNGTSGNGTSGNSTGGTDGAAGNGGTGGGGKHG